MPRCVPPVECVVEVEGSGAWPHHRGAFVHTKAALGAQLATKLEAEGWVTRAGLGHVDVLGRGHAIRLVVHTDRCALGGLLGGWREDMGLRKG